MGENEKTENVLKRAHGDGVTPEKKRKVDDEGTLGDDLFRNSAVFKLKRLKAYLIPVWNSHGQSGDAAKRSNPFAYPIHLPFATDRVRH